MKKLTLLMAVGITITFAACSGSGQSTATDSTAAMPADTAIKTTDTAAMPVDTTTKLPADTTKAK